MKFIKFILILILTKTNLFAIDTLTVKEIGSGVVYYHIKTEEPNNIYILKINLLKNNVIKSVIAEERIGNNGQTVSQMSKKLSNSDYVIAGVNCDFFGGEPYQFENSMIIDGEFAKGTNIKRSLFAITDKKIPFIDTIKFIGYLKNKSYEWRINNLNVTKKEDSINIFNKYYNIPLQLKNNQVAFILKPLVNSVINQEQKYLVVSKYEKEIPKFLFSDRLLLIIRDDLAKGKFFVKDTLGIYLGVDPKIDNIYQMIGGLPKILFSGKTISDFNGIEGLTSLKFFGKNPRTAIGYDEKKENLFIVVVDGRDDKNSVGMTLAELSEFMKNLGCYEALNFDGGGSSTMVIRDSVVNKPSDITGERKVYNALFVCDLLLDEDNINSLSISLTKNELYVNETTQIDIQAFDKWGYKGKLNNNLITYYYDKDYLEINDGTIKALKKGETKITYKYKNFLGDIYLKIY